LENISYDTGSDDERKYTILLIMTENVPMKDVFESGVYLLHMHSSEFSISHRASLFITI
jgi:hypothetical protein